MIQFYSVIPVLARQSASARRRENGNPGKMIWIPAGVYPDGNRGRNDKNGPYETIPKLSDRRNPQILLLQFFIRN